MVKPDPSPPPAGGKTPSVSGALGSSGPVISATAALSNATTTVSSAKDPSRPRRKKARRACFACQRAHLTCGDERPCQRCIKRGLQDACHDGVRKKAKYLHDAPLDDSIPEFAPQPPPSSIGPSYPYMPQVPPPAAATDMLPPDGTINPNSIESPGNGLGPPPGNVESPLQQSSYSATPLFDPSDPALFNFDIASLNFGSQYGALEFGMLGQMSSANQSGGGVGTPENGSVGSNYGYSPSMTVDYVGFSAPQGEGSQFADGWAHSRNNSVPGAREGRHGPEGGFAGTYMIEAGPGSLTSPSPPVESPQQVYAQNPQQSTGSYTESAVNNTGALSSPNFYQNNHRAPVAQSSIQPQKLPMNPQSGLQRRRRLPEDPSQIYSSITAPYPYTLQFHRLFHLLESRFPKPLLLRIARAMASFRPSFIACTQTLKAEDLLFMEKCFQRTLWEYERFIQSCGTPTIVCRRTGEVVGVGKEFCMLTGWEKPILLGEKPNLNTNVPVINPQRPQHSNHNNNNNSNTLLPPPPTETEEPGLGGYRKPVFLAELLDDESVVEFYEQFARLAFGDSRGAVMTTCKVLKYRPAPPITKQQNGGSGGCVGEEGKIKDPASLEDHHHHSHNHSNNNNPNRPPEVAPRTPEKLRRHQPPPLPPPAGMDGLGSKDGKVECAFCWTIKRDVFDIPMLIVGNFLPILPRAGEGG